MLLHEYVDRWAAQRPTGEFAVQGERRTTWAQARDLGIRGAGVLQRAGLGPGDRCAVVEPGVLNGDLQRALQPHGLFWPPDPTSADYATVGGNLAWKGSRGQARAFMP